MYVFAQLVVAFYLMNCTVGVTEVPKEKGFILDKKSSGIDTFTSYVRSRFFSRPEQVFSRPEQLLLRKNYVRSKICWYSLLVAKYEST